MGVPPRDVGPDADPPIPDPPYIGTELAAQRAIGRSGGDGGGDPPGLEPRVAKLEAHVETLRADVAAIRKDVGDIRVAFATLTERVAHLPGKGFVVTTTTTAIAIISGLIIFGEKLKALLGL
ncbi:MAG: hypothetical protein JO013_16090 [Alphaproteobacteria bacterium]|nr:hypothetical protein [Alphaproteobacteria bacterium]